MKMGTDTVKRVYLGSGKVYEYDLAVSANLSGCSAEIPDSVYYGEALAFTLVPDSGHQQLPWNTKVTMGGVDITSQVYDKSTGTISISSVTGDIVIEAEAVMMPSEYEPVEYIRNVIRGRYNSTIHPYFQTGVYATENTELEFDIEIDQDAYNNYGIIFTTPGMTNTNFTEPAFSMTMRWAGTGYGGAKWGNAAVASSSFGWNMPALNTRQTIKMGKGVAMFKNRVDSYKTITFDSTLETPWANPREICLQGGQNTSSSDRGSYLKIWGAKIYENGEDIRNYYPARRKSDELKGLYDVINQTFLINKTTSGNETTVGGWIAPCINLRYSLENCSALHINALKYGGTEVAEIGSPWVGKITPSSGYTFVGGTTPQVLIDGIDVTSQVVTDNGDGTYNVTIANVEDKPIEITAVAVSDGTANATNSVTPLSNNTENNEEEM